MNNSMIQNRLLSLACAFENDENRKYAVRLLAASVAEIENDLKLAHDRIKILEEALYESLALNINWSEDADAESLSYFSEYRAVIKEGKEALGKEI